MLDHPVHVSLVAGDANQDLRFDQLDLVQVLAAGTYLTGLSATWGEGDWDAAPAMRGDGVFNQLDIVAAQQAGAYLAGSYYRQGGDAGQENKGPALAALSASRVAGNRHVSLIHNAVSGSLSVEVYPGAELTSINIDSAAGIFTGSPFGSLGGGFDNSTSSNIFKATFGSSFGSLDFGDVARPGLSEAVVRGDLTVVGSLAGGGVLSGVDLIYVPEPSTVALALFGLLIFGCCRRKQVDSAYQQVRRRLLGKAPP